jgi:hypothetical protein
VAGDRRKLLNGEVHNLYPLITYVACLSVMRNAYRMFVGKPEWRRSETYAWM